MAVRRRRASDMPILRELLPIAPIAGLTLVLLSGVMPADAQTRPTREVPGSTTPTAAAQEKPIILVDLGHGRVIAMGEMMAPLFLGEVNAVRLGGAIRPNEFGPYWGKDSREFMVEIVSWLTYRMR
jgi:hypothetical protein